MTNYYHIERGPPCGSSVNAGASYTPHGPYKTFLDALNATDGAGRSLLHGHTPLRILRERHGERWEVWPTLSAAPSQI